MKKVLSVSQARSSYLRILSEAKHTSSTAERASAAKRVKQAAEDLQQAQRRDRIHPGKRRVSRPLDWNVENV